MHIFSSLQIHNYTADEGKRLELILACTGIPYFRLTLLATLIVRQRCHTKLRKSFIWGSQWGARHLSGGRGPPWPPLEPPLYRSWSCDMRSWPIFSLGKYCGRVNAAWWLAVEQTVWKSCGMITLRLKRTTWQHRFNWRPEFRFDVT